MLDMDVDVDVDPVSCEFRIPYPVSVSISIPIFDCIWLGDSFNFHSSFNRACNSVMKTECCVFILYLCVSACPKHTHTQTHRYTNLFAFMNMYPVIDSFLWLPCLLLYFDCVFPMTFFTPPDFRIFSGQDIL